MTRAPYVLGKAESAYDRSQPLFDTTLGWRFPNPKMEALFPLESMGETAENIYAETHIPRERQDAFALESQRRAVAAINAGRFVDEIAPVPIPQRKGEPLWIDTDGHPQMKKVGDRYELSTSAEKLAALKPVFRPGGTVTAGNASGLNDGAAALLLASEERAAALGLRPLVRIVGSASAGVDPRTMGYGPIPAVRKLLQRTGLSCCRSRPDRAQRGLRRAGPGRHGRARAAARPHQRQRRRHRPGPSPRLFRRAPDDDLGARDETPPPVRCRRQSIRFGYAVCRCRPGCGDTGGVGRLSVGEGLY